MDLTTSLAAAETPQRTDIAALGLVTEEGSQAWEGPVPLTPISTFQSEPWVHREVNVSVSVLHRERGSGSTLVLPVHSSAPPTRMSAL